MSNLASKLAATPAPSTTGVRRGPANACFPLYGHGDHEDWEAVERLRDVDGLTWREVQEHVDKLAGVTTPLPLEKFRYHWRRFCFCWPNELRR